MLPDSTEAIEEKLMPCPACGNKVSKKAKTCPKCGHPL